MLEVWCEEFTPDTFLQQTALTFTASLHGRLETHKREAERDLALAYNTGAFSRADSKSVRPLSHYMRQLRPSAIQSNAGLLAGFQTLKARGFPVKIVRVPRQKREIN